jgi:hypothetical protein
MKKLGKLIWSVLGVSMAFVNRTANELGRLVESGVTLPSSATTEYSSEISGIKVRVNDDKKMNQYVSWLIEASAVSGTNVDINLHGAHTSGGTKFLLKADLVTALTNSVKARGAVIDMKAYPASFYYIGWTSDANESANTISVSVSGDLNGSQ